MSTIAIIVLLVAGGAFFAAAAYGLWRALDPDYEKPRRRRSYDSGGDAAVPVISDSADSGPRWFGSSSSGGSDAASCDTGVSDSGGACDAGGGGGGGD